MAEHIAADAEAQAFLDDWATPEPLSHYLTAVLPPAPASDLPGQDTDPRSHGLADQRC